MGGVESALYVSVENQVHSLWEWYFAKVKEGVGHEQGPWEPAKHVPISEEACVAEMRVKRDEISGVRELWFLLWEKWRST